MSKIFSRKAGVSNNEQTENTKKIVPKFVRVEGDNKLFPQIQVKDISKVTDENTRWKLDGDGIVWKACSAVETLYITIECEKEGIKEDLQGITVFKGLGNNISTDSWLGVENVKREVKGLTPLKPEDFTVTEKNKLNYKTEDIAFEQVQIMIRTKLKNLREQFLIDNIDFCIGNSGSFRDSLPLPSKYKGTRSPLRPILLKKVRDWVLSDLKGELSPENYECDDYVEWFGYQGYQDYKKKNIFTFGVIGEDKDMMSNPKLLVNFGTHSGKDNPNKGKFKFPNAWLIPDSGISVGEIDLVVKTKKEFKASGLVWLMAQAFLIGDSADSYLPLRHLPVKANYGDVKAYQDFVNLKTPKEVLQKVVDLWSDWLPYGCQYTTFNGVEKDVPTMEVMNTYFLTAYMTRSDKDSLDWYKLCKAFKVDTSKIVDNNLLTPPVKTYIGNEDHVKSVEDLISEIIKIDMKGIKSLKKVEQAPVLDRIKEKLLSIDFDSHYEMQQKVKSDQSVVIPKKVYTKSLHDHIVEYNTKNNYEISDRGNYETFIESLSEDIVFEEITDEHRWYSIQDQVHKVTIDGDERFFRTFDYYMTGDDSAYDMDLDLPTLNDVTEVFPEQVMQTVYG